MAGGATSGSSNTVYIDSAAGIGEGARTGLASVVTGLLFLGSMFLTPLTRVVPLEVAAAALVVVGAMMMAQIREIKFTKFSVALPAFLTIVTMPLTYSIANGIGVGFISWAVIQRGIGQGQEGPSADVGGDRGLRDLLCPRSDQRVCWARSRPLRRRSGRSHRNE